MHLVIANGGVDHDLDVDLDDPDATVDDLLTALELGAVGDVGVVHAGRRFGRQHCLADLGLVPGDRLVLGRAPASPDGGLTIGITSGPDAGRRITLDGSPTTASVVVGRARSCDVAVADPTLSARHLRLSADGGRLRLEDLDSTNGTYVDGHRARGAVDLAGGEVQAGATTLVLLGDPPDDAPADARRPTWGHAMVHNRPPRATLEPAPDPLPVAAPPSGDVKKPIFNLASLIGPVVMGGAMVMIYGNPRFALFALLSPLMAITNWISGKRRAKKARVTGAVDYAEAVVDLDRDLEARSTAERLRHRSRTPDPMEVARRAAQPSTRLWERRSVHDDFLELSVGRGATRWHAFEEPADPPPEEMAEVLDRWRHLRDAPVTIDLAAGPVGLFGAAGATAGVARWLLVQAAVHHGPADVRVIVVTTPERAEEWDWVKWLPHATDPVTSSVRVATTGAELEAILERLGPDTDDVPGFRTARTVEEPSGPTTLVVVDDPSVFDGRRSAVRSLLRGDRGPASGIVLAETEDRLPASCVVVVEARADGDLTVTWPAERTSVADVVAIGVTTATATAVARDLARFEDAEQEIVGGDLPTACRLLPLLGLADPIDPDQIVERWSQGGDDPAPSSPIGIGENGIMHVDLAKDGPHALVGGTTGSGKSELLRTWVAGLAASLDPDKLVFVLVDYKGGSAFDECARLPHTVGMVTDLDEHLGERALRSLEAELHHREHVLRAAQAGDLPEYRRKGSTQGPLPRLVVVIDEFATLAAELPDFLGALVGIAQRGRSLGVHLVLATQRPQGSVNANIKANTNLRIALRVQDAQDSTDVIDKPAAASISQETPGRLYVRRGHGDLLAVQSARSTGPITASSRTAVTLRPFRARPDAADRTEDQGDPERSELRALVDATCEAFRRRGVQPPRRPWLEMLDTELDWDQLAAVSGGVGAVPVPFAIGDDPDRQLRVPLGWDPAGGNLGLFGMVGSGVTTAVRALIRSVVERHTPAELHVYVVDGGGELADLDALPHVGGVVALAERERLIRLIRLLGGELDRRRGLDSSARAAAATIVLAVDGFGSLVAEAANLEVDGVADDLRRVVNEGPGVGIVTVAAADRAGALGTRYGAALAQRFLFRHADPSEFSAIGVRPRSLPAFAPGRFIEAGDQLVGQVADPGTRWIDAIASTTPDVADRGPTPITVLPSEVASPTLPAARLDLDELAVTVGIAEDDLAPVELVLRAGDHAIVAGPPSSGRSSTLVHLATQLRAADPGLVLVGIASARSPLSGRAELDAYGSLEDLAHVVAAGATDERTWVVLIDDAGRVDDVGGALAGLLASNRPGLHVVAAGRADDFRSHGSWTRPLRRSRTGILLKPDVATDGDVLTVRLPRRLPVSLVTGRGFVVNGGEPTLAQMAHPGG